MTDLDKLLYTLVVVCLLAIASLVTLIFIYRNTTPEAQKTAVLEALQTTNMTVYEQ